MTSGVLRMNGPLALLAVGAVHLQQVVANHSSSPPTIGPVLLLDFAGATALGLALLLPVHRVADWLRGRGGIASAPLAAAGTGLAARSFSFLFISENQPLSGFQEQGHRPAIIRRAGGRGTRRRGFVARQVTDLQQRRVDPLPVRPPAGSML
jgi:hypothetical protein